MAQGEVNALIEAVAAAAPGKWQQLLSAPSAAAFFASPGGGWLKAVILAENAEIPNRIAAIYGRDGRLLFSRRPEPLDTYPRLLDVAAVVQTFDPLLLHEAGKVGRPVYRLFLPVGAAAKATQVIVELVFTGERGALDHHTQWAGSGCDAPRFMLMLASGS